MNKKAQMIVGGAVLIVTVVVLLMISLLVVNKVRSSVHANLYNDSYNVTSGAGKLSSQDAYVDVRDNTNTAFSLVAISLIVLVAMLIISLLRG